MNYKIFCILLLILLAGLVYWWIEMPSKTNIYTREDSRVQPEEVIAPPDQSQVMQNEPAFFDITSEDCQSECVNLAEKSDTYTYCRNFCGLSFEPSPIGESKTTGQSTLNEAYTLKEEAIQKKDLSLCADIRDANIRKSCEVRVTEDLLE